MKREEKINKLILLQKEANIKNGKICDKLDEVTQELRDYYTKLCGKYDEFPKNYYYEYDEEQQVPEWMYVKATVEEIKTAMNMEREKMKLLKLHIDMCSKIKKLSKKLDKFVY